MTGEINTCNFCRAETEVNRQYLHAKNKPLVGDGFKFIYYCNDCGLLEIINTPTIITIELRDFIALKLGETSMCWSETPKGRFESEKVSKILDEIMEYIRTTYPLGDCVGEIGKEKAIDNLKRYESDLKAEWSFSVDTVATLTPPTELNWSELKQTSIDQTATPGTFTLNPETLNKNYEGITPLILDMSEYIGKPLAEVSQSVIEKYSTTHYIPDYSYLTYLRDNPDQFPESMKDGNWYYTPATAIGYSHGDVIVPCVRWNGGKPDLDGVSVENDWDGFDRVLLLPR